MFELNKLEAGQVLLWPNFNLILLKRLSDSGFLDVHNQPHGLTVSGMGVYPCQLSLTTKGRAFMEELGLHEM